MTLDSPAVVATIREIVSKSAGERLYGVVDAARCVDLAFEAKIQFGKEIRSLFLPELQTQLWDVSPYLVPIDPASDYLHSWAGHWGKSAGVLLTTNASEDALFAHLRRIFVVEDETKQEYFFRFYDPRVLRVFLPTCSTEQLDEFFGPIAEITAEGSAGGSVLRFERNGNEPALTPSEPRSESGM
jgi:hypothetical protein